MPYCGRSGGFVFHPYVCAGLFRVVGKSDPGGSDKPAFLYRKAPILKAAKNRPERSGFVNCGNYQKLIKAPRLSIISVKKVLTSERVSSSTGLKSSILAG